MHLRMYDVIIGPYNEHSWVITLKSLSESLIWEAINNNRTTIEHHTVNQSTMQNLTNLQRETLRTIH